MEFVTGDLGIVEAILEFSDTLTFSPHKKRKLLNDPSTSYLICLLPFGFDENDSPPIKDGVLDLIVEARKIDLSV